MCYLWYLDDPGKARGCSTIILVIHSLQDPFPQLAFQRCHAIGSKVTKKIMNRYTLPIGGVALGGRKAGFFFNIYFLVSTQIDVYNLRYWTSSLSLQNWLIQFKILNFFFVITKLTALIAAFNCIEKKTKICHENI